MKIIILIFAAVTFALILLSVFLSALAFFYYKFKRKKLIDPLAIWLEREAVRLWIMTFRFFIGLIIIISILKLFGNE